MAGAPGTRRGRLGERFALRDALRPEKRVGRASEYIAQAAQHHDAACIAHDSGNDRALAAAHRALGASLRGVERCLRSMAADAAAADIKNSQTIQTSAGTKQSTGSADGRTGSPLLHGDVSGWLSRAFPKVRS